MKNVAVILAGGIGSRVGEKIPKQFINIFGKPVIVYTIEKFQKHCEIDFIEVVCLESYIPYLNGLIKKYNLNKVKLVVKGGKDFQHSVIEGITNLNDYCDPEDIVLIHYAASPFVSDEIISDAIAVCKKKKNCTSATPVYLLTGTNDGDHSENWVDRDKLMCLNTPQTFTYQYVTDLYKEAVNRKLLDKVEPHTTSLMFLMGRKIFFSKGSQTNIKITTKEDLELFKGFILNKESKEVK